MAEAFLLFSEIPETGHDSGLESLEQIHLKLSRPTDRSKNVIMFSVGRAVRGKMGQRGETVRDARQIFPSIFGSNWAGNVGHR